LEEFFTWGLLLLFGALSGFAAGLFGIGGGIILVPFFLWFFSSLGVPENLTVKLSVGTSLAVITAVALFTSGFHFLKGRLNWKELAGTILWVALGVSLGVALSSLLPVTVFKKGFALVLLVTALRLFRGRAGVRLQIGERFLIPISVYLSALLSSMFGIGGGIVINSLLFTFSERSTERVVALASAVSFFNAFLGSCFYGLAPVQKVLEWQFGYIYLPALFLTTFGAIPAIKLGVHLLYRVNSLLLKKAFALLLFLVSIKLFL